MIAAPLEALQPHRDSSPPLAAKVAELREWEQRLRALDRDQAAREIRLERLAEGIINARDLRRLETDLSAMERREKELDGTITELEDAIAAREKHLFHVDDRITECTRILGKLEKEVCTETARLNAIIDEINTADQKIAHSLDDILTYSVWSPDSAESADRIETALRDSGRFASLHKKYDRHTNNTYFVGQLRSSGNSPPKTVTLGVNWSTKTTWWQINEPKTWF